MGAHDCSTLKSKWTKDTLDTLEGLQAPKFQAQQLPLYPLLTYHPLNESKRKYSQYFSIVFSVFSSSIAKIQAAHGRRPGTKPSNSSAASAGHQWRWRSCWLRPTRRPAVATTSTCREELLLVSYGFMVISWVAEISKAMEDMFGNSSL